MKKTISLFLGAMSIFLVALFKLVPYDLPKVPDELHVYVIYPLPEEESEFFIFYPINERNKCQEDLCDLLYVDTEERKYYVYTQKRSTKGIVYQYTNSHKNFSINSAILTFIEKTLK